MGVGIFLFLIILGGEYIYILMIFFKIKINILDGDILIFWRNFIWK